jgi:hypothetical protein
VNELILLAALMASAGLSVMAALWLERVARRPGLFFLILGVAGVFATGLSFKIEDTLMPVLSIIFGVQTVGFFYFAWWRHDVAQNEGGRRIGASNSSDSEHLVGRRST